MTMSKVMAAMTATMTAAVIGLSALSAPAMAQSNRQPAPQAEQNQSAKPAPKRKAAPPTPAQQWKQGERYTGKGTQVDYRKHKLPQPGKGQYWVKDGERFLLLKPKTGTIAAIARAASH